MQFLSGLTSATPLFLVAAALTLSFRAARLLDLAQPAIATLAASFAALLAARLSLDPAVAIPATIVTAAALGAATDRLIYRRLDRASLLAQLLAALGLFLLFERAAELLRPVPPHFVWPDIPLAIATPALLALIPASVAILRLVPRIASRTALVAAAAALSALAGTLAPLTTAQPGLDLLVRALLAVLLGGLGSLLGALLATLALTALQLLADPLFPHASLVLSIALTAATLLLRPDGLLGHPVPDPAPPPHPLTIRPAPLSARLLAFAALTLAGATLVLAPIVLPLVTVASLAILLAAAIHVLLGPGGIPSLGHAAFATIGAAATTLFLQAAAHDPLGRAAAPLAGLLAATAAALVVGAVLTRLPARALAILSLAIAHLVWSAAAIGVPSPNPVPFAQPMTASLVIALCLGVTLLLRRLLYAPFGYALRATRDDPARAAAIGLPVASLRLAAFTLSGAAAGLAGALAALVTPTLPLGGIDAAATLLLMPLLGGLQVMAGPIVGALATVGLAASPLWPLLLGPALLFVVLALPDGIAGTALRAWRRSLPRRAHDDRLTIP